MFDVQLIDMAQKDCVGKAIWIVNKIVVMALGPLFETPRMYANGVFEEEKILDI